MTDDPRAVTGTGGQALPRGLRPAVAWAAPAWSRVAAQLTRRFGASSDGVPGSAMSALIRRPSSTAGRPPGCEQAALRSGARREGEDLHTICTCSASFLHPRELPCLVIGPRPAGGFGGMACQQHAGAFFLSCKFTRTLPVILSSVYGVVPTAGPRRFCRVEQWLHEAI